MDGYFTEEAREYLENKGYSWKKFLTWMRGQTVSIDEEGRTIYYSYDVERYRE